MVVYKDRLVVMPQSLLISPCDGVEAGDTVRSLAKGYVANTSCLAQHKVLLQKQTEYKKSMEKLYGSGK